LAAGDVVTLEAANSLADQLVWVGHGTTDDDIAAEHDTNSQE